MMCLCGMGSCVMVHMWRSKDNFLVLVPSSYLYEGSREHTQVARLYAKCHHHLMSYHTVWQAPPPPDELPHWGYLFHFPHTYKLAIEP